MRNFHDPCDFFLASDPRCTTHQGLEWPSVSGFSYAIAESDGPKVPDQVQKAEDAPAMAGNGIKRQRKLPVLTILPLRSFRTANLANKPWLSA